VSAGSLRGSAANGIMIYYLLSDIDGEQIGACRIDGRQWTRATNGYASAALSDLAALGAGHRSAPWSAAVISSCTFRTIVARADVVVGRPQHVVEERSASTRSLTETDVVTDAMKKCSSSRSTELILRCAEERSC